MFRVLTNECRHRLVPAVINARDQSSESCQSDLSTKFCKLFWQVAEICSEIYAGKQKVSDEKLNKGHNYWPQPDRNMSPTEIW